MEFCLDGHYMYWKNILLFGSDIVFHPFPMVSERVKSVLELYEPALQWKQSMLLEQKRGRVEIYYVPLLEEKEYLSERTVFTMNHSNIQSLVLKQEKIGDSAIFNLKGEQGGFYSPAIRFSRKLMEKESKRVSIKRSRLYGRRKYMPELDYLVREHCYNVIVKPIQED